MALTAVNALISLKDGTTPPVNLAAGQVGLFTPGAPLVFALQSTVGIQRAEMTLLCPRYPGLHQLTHSWAPGQYNGWQITFPDSTLAGDASAFTGVSLVVTVTDCSSSSVTATTYLESNVYAPDGSFIAAGVIEPGNPITPAPGGGYVLADNAGLAASPSGVVEGVATEPARPPRAFNVAVDGRIPAALVPLIGPGSIDEYAAVNSAGGIVRSASMGLKSIGTCGLDGSVTLCLALWNGMLGGASVPTPVVTSVFPPVGWRRGSGIVLSITGTDFVTGAAVTVNGQSCSAVVVNSPTNITCATPTFVADGAYDVVVTNAGGTPSSPLVGGYRAVLSKLWLDASNLTLGALSTWPDRSDVPLDHTQGTGGLQPIVTAAAINSQKGADFASAKWMSQTGANPVGLGEAFTLLFIGKGGNGSIFALRRNAASSNCLLLNLSGTYYVATDSAGSTADTTAWSLTNPFTSVHVYPGNRAMSGVKLWIDGVSKVITPSGGNAESGVTGDYIGRNPDVGQEYNGFMGELVVLPGDQSATMVAVWQNYKTVKWI